MNRPSVIIAAMLLASASVVAQTTQGGITPKMLQRIEQAQQGGSADKALFNAIASNNIDDLAKNFANQGPVSTYFSVETPKQSIHDQQKSGRCWMFSGFNVLRADFAKAHGDSVRVEFSQAYLFFYDQLEKANLMLQGVVDGVGCHSEVFPDGDGDGLMIEAEDDEVHFMPRLRRFSATWRRRRRGR